MRASDDVFVSCRFFSRVESISLCGSNPSLCHEGSHNTPCATERGMLQAGSGSITKSAVFVPGCLADASVLKEDRAPRGMGIIEEDGSA